MSKRLYIIRHAKSSWAEAGMKDIDRPLNGRGKENAPDMGKHLKANFDVPNFVVSSPAKRAMQTARRICDQIDYPKNEIQQVKEIYEAAPDTLLEIINSLPNDKDIVYLFGHNPGMSMITSYLTDDYLTFKTCCIAVVDFEVNDWNAVSKGNGSIAAFLSPHDL